MKTLIRIICLLATCVSYADDQPKTRPTEIEFTEGKQHYILTPLYADAEQQRLTGYRVSTTDRNVIQDIPHEFDLSGTIPEYLPIVPFDCTFDGFTDLRLTDDGFSGTASRNQTYTFWVWDKKKGKFILHEQLTELGIRSIDPKTGYLHAGGNDGGGYWDHEVYKFTPDGKIIPVLAEGTTGRNANGEMIYKKTIYKNGKPYKTIRGQNPRD